MGSCPPEVSKHFPTDLIAQFSENLAADKANDVKHVKTVLLIQATLLHDTGMDECLRVMQSPAVTCNHTFSTVLQQVRGRIQP